MARSNHRAGSVVDRLGGWKLTGLVECPPFGNEDLVGEAIVNFFLLL